MKTPTKSPTSLPPADRQAYTIAGFCHDYSIGRTKANELMRDGVLETRHVGTRVLITAESVKRWFAGLPTEPPEQSVSRASKAVRARQSKLAKAA